MRPRHPGDRLRHDERLQPLRPPVGKDPGLRDLQGAALHPLVWPQSSHVLCKVYLQNDEVRCGDSCLVRWPQEDPGRRMAMLDGCARTLMASYKRGYYMHSEFVFGDEAANITKTDNAGGCGSSVPPGPPRFYTPRECARLMGFPEDFRGPGLQPRLSSPWERGLPADRGRHRRGDASGLRTGRKQRYTSIALGKKLCRGCSRCLV